ncbi:polyadenylate-binding protein-interacting protein 9-like [Wolffia australiana]
MVAVAETAIGSNDRQFPHQLDPSSSPPRSPSSSDCNSDFQRDVRKLVDLLSKLNPSAKEFVPLSKSKSSSPLSANAPAFDMISTGGEDSDNQKQSGADSRRKRNVYNQGKRRAEGVLKCQRDDSIRRTVYVSDIDMHVTEEQLAALFTCCGQVVDCRVCGDPHSFLRFAFVEFADEHSARTALNLSGTMIGYYPLRVLPSKTAILPVNPTFLPRSEDEREMCSRTIYCTNIDKKVTQTDVRAFFEACCGEVSRLRLLGDHAHSTRIAFVEFVQADSATVALSRSGMRLGDLPIRVSPSKTPVRPRVPRQR